MLSVGSANQKQADEKFCSECGVIIRAKAEICPKCGVRQGSVHEFSVNTPFSSIAPNGKSRLTAALLALLLGGIGIHKFYLGRIVQGVLYLLFCWTFIPAIIGLIEGIVLLSMSDKDFIYKYGNS